MHGKCILHGQRLLSEVRDTGVEYIAALNLYVCAQLLNSEEEEEMLMIFIVSNRLGRRLEE
jgi:hypothetical protein